MLAAFYNSMNVQVVLALLIFTNFLYNIANSSPCKTRLAMFYNVCFAIDVILNMSAHCQSFWQSGSNLVDVIATSIGLIGITDMANSIPGFGIMRTVVLLRIFRLFKRIQSLNMIIVAHIRPLRGYANSLVIPTTIFWLQVALAQALWSEGYPELFGDVHKSLVSIFLVWTLNASRVQPLLDDQPWAILFFMIVYILELLSFKVIGAIILDGMSEKEEEAAAEDQYTGLQPVQ